MPWTVSSDPLRFEEALAWFLSRVPLTEAELATLTEAARTHAFWVAGVAHLDIATQAWELLAEAQRDGLHLATNKDRILERLEGVLERDWGGTVRNPGRRTETIYRNAMQSSYSRGRYSQMTHPDVLAARPYWLFDAILDGDQTAICEARDGVVRLATDPWWRTNIPPLHHRCRSGIRSLTAAQAEARGGATLAPVMDPPPGRGWGAAPEPTWPVERDDYPPALWSWWERARQRA